MENIRTLSYAYINFYIEHPTYYSFMYRNTYIKIEFTMEKKEENYPPYNVFVSSMGDWQKKLEYRLRSHLLG